MSIQQDDWVHLSPRPQPRNLPPPRFDEWSWQLQGSCQGYPLELFYPEERGQLLRTREERAKRICRECPVIDACRKYSLRAPEAFGIWGALTPRERARYLAGDPPRPDAGVVNPSVAQLIPAEVDEGANLNMPGASTSGSNRQS